MFITFEGSEGSGKSTQARRLAARLRSGGWRVRELREPGGTPLAEEIRTLLKYAAAGTGMSSETELLLMNAARAQLVREVIRPALEGGEVVVCDRFYDSTVAYQGWGRRMDLDRVRQVIDLAVGSTRPDLTLWLRVPLDEGNRRRADRSAEVVGGARDRFEAEDRAFFERVEQGFDAIAAAEPARVRVIEGSGTVEEVGELIWREVASRMPSVGGRLGESAPVQDAGVMRFG